MYAAKMQLIVSIPKLLQIVIFYMKNTEHTHNNNKHKTIAIFSSSLITQQPFIHNYEAMGEET
jgi:hypothetical protein